MVHELEMRLISKYAKHNPDVYDSERSYITHVKEDAKRFFSSLGMADQLVCKSGIFSTKRIRYSPRSLPSLQLSAAPELWAPHSYLSRGVKAPVFYLRFPAGSDDLLLLESAIDNFFLQAEGTDVKIELKEGRKIISKGMSLLVKYAQNRPSSMIVRLLDENREVTELLL